MNCEVIYLPNDEELLPMPISWDELNGMRAAAAHYMQHGTKTEKRLARRLAHAEAWIRAEAKAIGAQGPVIQTEQVH